MGKIVFINAMCIVASLVATFVHTMQKEEKLKIKFDYKIFVFYYCMFISIIAFFKAIVGYHDSYLMDSYSVIGINTVLHYFSILMILSLIISITLKILSKKLNILRAIWYFDSVYFFLWSLIYYIGGGVTNAFYIIIFMISLIASIVVIFLMKKENIEYVVNDINKKNIVYISSIILFGIITTYIYVPQETFIANINEIVMSYQVYASSLLIGAMILIIIYIMGSLLLLSQKQLEIYTVVYFSINFLGYIQTNFLNGNMQALDGQIQKWDSETIVLNIIIWLIIPIILLALSLFTKYKKIVKKVIQIMAVYITLMQLVALGVLLIGVDKKNEESYVFSKDYMLELSDENNVIVFVLDWFDQQIMEELVSKDATVLEDFSGFTMYNNVTSNYAFTYMSIPYLMTGIEWELGMSEYDYYHYAIENTELLTNIHDNGFNIGIYSDHYFADRVLKDKVNNVRIDEGSLVDMVATFDLGEKSARYRMAPFFVKSKFMYYEWEFSNLQYANQYLISYDFVFMNDLKNEGISIQKDNDEKGSYRLYHMNGAHIPYNLNSNGEGYEYDVLGDSEESRQELLFNQARGCLKIVSTYIEQMKDLGLFKNATIIITADHGQNLYLEEEERTDEMWKLTSSPIMLVKLPQDGEEKGIRYSNAPVSHQEVIAQVLKSTGIENNMKTFTDFEENEARERVFIYGRSGDIPFRKYVINGDVREEKSWTKVPLQ